MGVMTIIHPDIRHAPSFVITLTWDAWPVAGFASRFYLTCRIIHATVIASANLTVRR
jgi:hypothetical protein